MRVQGHWQTRQMHLRWRPIHSRLQAWRFPEICHRLEQGRYTCGRVGLDQNLKGDERCPDWACNRTLAGRDAYHLACLGAFAESTVTEAVEVYARLTEGMFASLPLFGLSAFSEGPFLRNQPSDP